MNIIAIIPAIERKDVGWEHNEQFFADNKEFLDDKGLISELFVYCSPTDAHRFSSYKTMKMKHRYKMEMLNYSRWVTPKLFENRYRERHSEEGALCLDFMEAMEQLLESNYDYALWIEDRGYLKQDAKKIIVDFVYQEVDYVVLSKQSAAALIKKEFAKKLVRIMKGFEVAENKISLNQSLYLPRKVEEKELVSMVPSESRNIKKKVPEDLKRFF